MKIDLIRKANTEDGELVLNLVEGWDDPRTQETAEKLLKHILTSNEKTIRYGEFARMVSFECSPRLIDRFLGALSYSCIESGLPPVSVMVVNEEGLPGNGFFKAYYPAMKDDMERMKICLEQMDRVKKYKHWDVVLNLFTGKE